jgi:tape measure domain-containing protein
MAEVKVVMTTETAGAVKTFQQATKSMSTSLNKLNKDTARAFNSVVSANKSTAASFTALNRAIAGVAIGSLAKEMVSGAVALERAEVALKNATQGFEDFNEAQKFLMDTSQKLGLVYADQIKGYAQLAASAKLAGVSLEDTKTIYLGIAEASTAMQLSQDDAYGAMRAVVQMMSKGKVQAEELRGQLGERLPGAAQLAAKALGVTEAELSKLLETGKIYAKDFLPLFGQALRDNYGKAAIESATSAQAALNRFANSIQMLQKQIMVGDNFDRFKELLGSIGGILQDTKVISDLKAIAGAVMIVLKAVADLVGMFAKAGLVFPTVLGLTIMWLGRTVVSFSKAVKEAEAFSNAMKKLADIRKTLAAMPSHPGYKPYIPPTFEKGLLYPKIIKPAQEEVIPASMMQYKEITKQATLLAVATNLWSKALGGVKLALTAIVGLARGIFAALGGLPGVIIMATIWIGSWLLELESVQKVLGKVWDWIKQIATSIRDGWTYAVETFSAFIKLQWLGIYNVIMDLLDKVRIWWFTFIRDLTASLMRLADSMPDWLGAKKLSDAATADFNEANKTLGNIYQGMSDRAEELKKAIDELSAASARAKNEIDMRKTPTEVDKFRGTFKPAGAERDASNLANKLFSEKRLNDKVKEFEQFAERLEDMYEDLNLEILEIGQTGIQKEIAQAESKYGKMLNDAKKYSISVAELEQARANELKDKTGNLEINAINEKYDKLVAAAKQQGELMSLIEKAKSMKILDIWKKHYAEMQQMIEESALDYQATAERNMAVLERIEIRRAELARDAAIRGGQEVEVANEIYNNKVATIKKNTNDQVLRYEQDLAVDTKEVYSDIADVMAKGYEDKVIAAEIAYQATISRLELERQRAIEVYGDIAAVREYYAAKSQQAEVEKIEAQKGPLQQWAEEYKSTMTLVQEWSITAGENFSNGFVDAIWEAVDGTMSLKDAFQNFAYEFFKNMSKMIMQQAILNAMQGAMGLYWGGGKTATGMTTNSFPGGFSGRASGGPVKSGETYVVGEQGPELLHMGSNGHISPNNSMRAYAQSQGVVVNTTVNVNGGTNSDPSQARKQGQMIADMVDAKVKQTLIEQQRTNGILRQRSI